MKPFLLSRRGNPAAGDDDKSALNLNLNFLSFVPALKQQQPRGIQAGRTGSGRPAEQLFRLAKSEKEKEKKNPFFCLSLWMQFNVDNIGGGGEAVNIYDEAYFDSLEKSYVNNN